VLQAVGRTRWQRVFETWPTDSGRTWAPITLTSEFGRRRGHAARWPAPHRLQPHDAGAHAAECRCVARRQNLERCARTGERSGRILVPGSDPGRRRTRAHHVYMETPAHQTCRDRSDDASVACYEPEPLTKAVISNRWFTATCVAGFLDCRMPIVMATVHLPSGLTRHPAASTR